MFFCRLIFAFGPFHVDLIFLELGTDRLRAYQQIKQVLIAVF